MTTKNLDEAVAVNLVYDDKLKKVFPKWVRWNNRLYPVTKVGLHHTYKQGEVLYHVFSVITKTLFMRLVLNTKNLNWKLEQIADGI